MNDIYKKCLIESDYLFPKNIYNKPKTSATLTFSYDFDQLLKEGDIPYGTKYIIFGYRFNQKIKKGDIQIQ